MSRFEEDSINVKGLDQLLKAFKAKLPVARVGILGTHTSRVAKPGEKNHPTNAEIGAAHEFGTSKMERRSFLRMPISENLQKEMEIQNLLNKDAMAKVIKSGSIIPWMEGVAISALACVKDAFASNGGGKWAPWKNPNYTNNTGQILVDTTDLRDSNTWEVK